MKLIDLHTVPQEKPREPTVIGPYTDPKEFLQQVMAAVELPLSQRMRAGIELLPYIHPKLAVTALVSEQSFAELLDKRLARIDAMNAKAKAIEQTNGQTIDPPHADPHMGPITAEVRKPLARTTDRRYRRF